MRLTILLFTFSFGLLIACGEKNTTSTPDDKREGTKRFEMMASHPSTIELLDDDYGILQLELINDRSFYIYRNNRRSRVIYSDNWYVEGKRIRLRGVGSGSYFSPVRNGVKYDCISLNPNTLSTFIVDELLRFGLNPRNITLSFCKRR